MILVFGDSLSAAHGLYTEQGWVNLLRQRLAQLTDLDKPWQVINASASGETTTGGLKRLPALLDAHHPRLCILELGANDGLLGLPLNRMRENLIQMVRLCQKHGKVLLLGMRLPPNYGPRYTREFEDSFQQVAAQTRIPYVPFLLDRVALSAELMQADGLHPNANAQPIILDNVWPLLLPIIHELNATSDVNGIPSTP